MSILRTQRLNISISGNKIVSDAWFSVNSGEVVALIGPNGAGKTTLLKAMMGLIRVESGDIDYDGVQIRFNQQFQFAKFISYLEQNSKSYWALSVESVVMLGRLPHLGRWRRPSAVDHQSVRKAMEVCDVLQFADRAVTTLSGGEQARVMLARTLATNPHFLLADEPVAGLDPAHQLDVMEKLRNLADGGAGIVVVMHDLTLASRYCDRMTLLFDGHIVADGVPQNVLSEEHLATAYGIEALYHESVHGNIVIPVRRLKK
ncbi:MAG: ABC transporter ATP-binding protein [Acidiferrobacterales bacterium]|nr:ABC transporter ATP-binding protein [Acidiferrobacterales bacterium]